MAPTPTDSAAFDWRRDAYLGWFYACAWRAARGDKSEAERLWQE